MYTCIYIYVYIYIYIHMNVYIYIYIYIDMPLSHGFADPWGVAQGVQGKPRLLAPMGPCGPAPCGPLWALVGRPLVGTPGPSW